jgi:hypothetical protein
MGVYTEGLFSDPLTQDDLAPTGDARRRAVVEETFGTLVGPALYRWGQLDEARRWGGMAFGDMSPDDARGWIESRGLTEHLTVEDRPYNKLELSILAERKEAELRRRYVLERAEGGFAQGSERLLLSLGTSLLDPLTVATAFVPVVSSSRYASLLERAGTGALARAGTRAAVGAAEGAVGQALVEPFVYASKQAEQADYGLYDSLANIAFGGVFGGGLHAVGGAVVDVRTARREKPLNDLLARLKALDERQAPVDATAPAARPLPRPVTTEQAATTIDALYLERRTKLTEQASARLDEPARVEAQARLQEARAAKLDELSPEEALAVQRTIAETEATLQAHDLAAAAERDLDKLDKRWNRAETLNEKADLLGFNARDRLFEASTLDAVGSLEARIKQLDAERADLEAQRTARDAEPADPDSPLAATRAEAKAADLRKLDNAISAKTEQATVLRQLAADWRGAAMKSAAGRAALASPQTREAALHGAVAQDLAGQDVNVEAAFELDPATRTRPVQETVEQLRRGEPEPVAEPVEVVEAAEAKAVEEQIADLEATLKDLEDEMKLDDAELPEEIRAELDEANALAEESEAFSEAARMLAACAMRSIA